MVLADIPELQSLSDLAYLKESFALDVTENMAAEMFRNLIDESLRLGWSTQLNWWIHNLVHK